MAFPYVISGVPPIGSCKLVDLDVTNANLRQWASSYLTGGALAYPVSEIVKINGSMWRYTGTVALGWYMLRECSGEGKWLEPGHYLLVGNPADAAPLRSQAASFSFASPVADGKTHPCAPAAQDWAAADQMIRLLYQD